MIFISQVMRLRWTYECDVFSSNPALNTKRIYHKGAVVVAQLVERSLPTSEVRGLNPVISKL